MKTFIAICQGIAWVIAVPFSIIRFIIFIVRSFNLFRKAALNLGNKEVFALYIELIEKKLDVQKLKQERFRLNIAWVAALFIFGVTPILPFLAVILLDYLNKQQ